MCNNKTVFLLGAGAMKPWGGPLASDIDKHLCEQDLYKTRKDPTKSVASFLFEKLNQHYPKAQSPNFETTIAFIEALYNYSYDKLKSLLYKEGHFNTSVFDLQDWINEIRDYVIEGDLKDDKNKPISIYKKHIQSLSSPTQLPKGTEDAHYFRDLLAFLLDRVGDKVTEYDNPANIATKEALNGRLFALLEPRKSNGITRIYTTNYDRLIPYIFRQHNTPVFDGFSDSLPKEYEVGFHPDIKRIMLDQESTNYYNLHGSMYWTYSTEISQLQPGFICTPNKEQSNYATFSQAAANPRESFFVSNIVTGYNKLQRTNLPPLNAFSYAFQRDCIEADTLVVVGYSYSDSHINRIIQNGIAATGNKQKRFFIGCLPEEAPEAYFEYGQEGFALAKNLYGKHGFDNRNMKIQDSWVSFQDRNCYVYRNGFQEFLEQESHDFLKTSKTFSN